MTRETTWHQKRALAAALTFHGLLGCAQIAGTDDYSLRVEPQAEPPLPFLAGSAECDACAAEACDDELTVCEKDEACSSWLTSIRERPNPAGTYERYRIESTLFWQSEHDGAPVNNSIAKLRQCAQDCLKACQIGRDFSCAGRFDWDLPPPETLRVGVGLNSDPVSAEISACLNSDQCEVPLSSSATDHEGFAELHFDMDPRARASIDYLSFVREEGLTWQWVQNRPFGDGEYVRLPLLSDELFSLWHDAFGQVFSGAQGVMLVTPVDCLGISAKEVKLELFRYSGSELSYCEDCFYAYGNDENGAPATIGGFQTKGTMGYIAKVDPGLVWVVLRRLAEPRDVVSATRLLIHGGEVTLVRASPSSRQDQMLFSGTRN